MIDDLVPTATPTGRRERRTRRRPRLRRFVVAFVIVFVVLEIAMRLFWPTALTSEGLPSRDVALKLAQIDARRDGKIAKPTVVLAGSSVAQRGLDPETFRRGLGLGDHAVYNAALRAATIEDTSEWLRHFVVPSLHPKTVVIGLSDFGLANATCSLCFDRNVAAKSWLGDAPFYADAANQVSWIFRYRGTLRNPVAAYNVVRDFHRENIENLDTNGFAPWVDTHWDGVGLGAAPPTTFAAGTDTLGTLVTWLKRRHVNVVLVGMPVPKSTGSTAYAALVNSWRELARREGVRFVELDAADYPQQQFADPVHLNEAGAHHASAAVVRTMTAPAGTP